MNDSADAKPRGRPKLAEGERKSFNLQIRTRAAIRERLEVAAARNGRSLSEEADRRLEESFAREGEETSRIRYEIEAAYSQVQLMMEEAAGGRYFLEVGRTMAGALKDALEGVGIDDSWPPVADWADDTQVRDALVRAARDAVLGPLEKLKGASEVLDDPRLFGVCEVLAGKNRKRIEAAIVEAERQA